MQLNVYIYEEIHQSLLTDGKEQAELADLIVPVTQKHCNGQFFSMTSCPHQKQNRSTLEQLWF